MRIKGKVSFLFLVIVITNTTQLFSQSLPDSTIKRIDSLFKKWDNNNSPGCSIGIIRNDSIIFSKGYGMANLEYGISIKPETIFHVASVSKQFTAYAIVLLANQGKLQLDDDIRKYLSWFPDLKEKITIRNLLNHTSGIRDQWQLLAISGTRLDDVITQDHIIKILSKQQALNFKPGEQYNYSNSGFTMLSEIIRNVTGQSLRQFTDSAIFKPLKMDNTHFHDDYTEIVKNRSYSYQRIDSTHYANSILSYSNAGATSLFTNVNDIGKWLMNYYDHTVGNQKDIDHLTQKGKLNNGKELNYAHGIEVNTYRGWKQFFHGGADAGYRTFITVYPDLKMGFILFSNLDDINPISKTYEVVNLFVKDTAKPTVAVPSQRTDGSIAVLQDTLTIKNHMGDYFSEDGLQFNFSMDRQKVSWKRYGRTTLLMQAEKDTFFSVANPLVKFVFNKTPETNRTITQTWPEGNRLLIKYVADTLQPDKQLQEYIGFYYCPELDSRYGITLKNHRLVLTNDKYNETQLTLAGANDLFNDFWWMSHLTVIRDDRKRIKGFEVNAGRIMHLRFNKIE